MIRHYFHRAPNPLKVQLLLEETGLAHEVIPIDIGNGDQHSAEFRTINPNGKVPAIIDTDGPDGDPVRVFDSNAILLYLAEKTGKLLGKPKDRPELLSWLFFVASGVGPYSGQAIHFRLIAPEDDRAPYAINRYQREAERHFSILDDRLTGRDYLLGEEFSIADIAAWGWVHYAGRILGVTDEPLRPFPNLKRWYDSINARPAVARVHAVGEKFSTQLGVDEATRRNLLPSNYPDLAAKWRKA